MAPERAEPLHVALHLCIAGQVAKGCHDVVPPHLLQPPEQIPRVIEHDPRAASLRDQVWDEICHPPIALGKRFGVVVISIVRVFHHELQV